MVNHQKQSLKELLLEIQKNKGLSDSAICIAISANSGTLKKFLNDPESVSFNVMEKIRAFTEDPDEYINGSKSFKQGDKGVHKLSVTKTGTVTLELLQELVKYDKRVLDEILETMGIMNVSRISIDQIERLAKKFEINS